MKWHQKYSKLITEIISMLFVLLFVYAAVSKLLDFENFRIQLAQSPMLSAYAGWLSWIVPIAEIFIAVLLLYTNTRYIGLLASLALMVMFTTYIYIILNHASNIPCSCGGVLEKMGWKTHLIFNIAFTLFALLAIHFHKKRDSKSKNKYAFYAMASVISLLSIVTVAMLFLTSERIIYEENPFIRRYSYNIPKIADINLNGDAFYFAGSSKQHIYLGNYSSPLIVKRINLQTSTVKTFKIKICNNNLPSIAAQVRVQPPYFFLIDGQISMILKGTTTNWEVGSQYQGNINFSNYQLTNDNTLLFKTLNPQSQKSDLGYLYIKDSLPYQIAPHLLNNESDEIFNADGSITYDGLTNHVSYTYFYKNKFLVMSEKLNNIITAHTIDTISKPNLIIDSTSNPQQLKLIASMMVNPASYTYNGFLYIRSQIKGRYEAEKTWKQTQTIDVYNILNGNYQTSFYIYKEQGKSLRHFFIKESIFYGFIGNKLVQYDLENMLHEDTHTNISRWQG